MWRGSFSLPHRLPLPLGEDTKPYERSELGGVGEGLCPVDRADPLTQLQLGNKLPSLRNPLPVGEGNFGYPSISAASTKGRLSRVPL